jgi:uncharacterized protein YjbJ (UPF0337 family)
MTMTQQERDALTQNWDQAKAQIQSQFPQVSDDDLNSARQNPDQLVDTIANSSGQDRTQVEQGLRSVAQQFGQSQSQNK